LQNPGNIYVDSGYYTVTFITYGPFVFDTVVKTNYIHVSNNAKPPKARFGMFYESGYAVQFNDFSSNLPEEWLWDFGDGETSTDRNPIHTYTAIDSYEVCLTVTNLKGGDEKCATLALIVNSIKSIAFKDIEIYPNPTNGLITISNLPKGNVYEATLFNHLGAKILTSTLGKSNKNIDLNNINNGVYYLQLSSTTANRTLKIIKN
jgi:PKD repeat protein